MTRLGDTADSVETHLIERYVEGEDLVVRPIIGIGDNPGREDGRWPVVYSPRWAGDEAPWALTPSHRFLTAEVESLGTPRRK